MKRGWNLHVVIIVGAILLGVGIVILGAGYGGAQEIILCNRIISHKEVILQKQNNFISSRA